MASTVLATCELVGDGGRDAAFEREALPWLDDVYRFALSLTRDDADADDVVQETYLRAYRSWHNFIPGTECRRWLFTICRTVFLRSRERQRPTVDLEDEMTPGGAERLCAHIAGCAQCREYD